MRAHGPLAQCHPGSWRRLVAEAVRRGIDTGRFTVRRAPERIAVVALALVDGIGIPLALGDPDLSPDSAAADMLAALADLVGRGADDPGADESGVGSHRRADQAADFRSACRGLRF